MADGTFYWHDYETWGTDPRRDRPSQFAGIRTDMELNILGDPQMIYCRPADDILPQPESALVTGLTPQKAHSEGVCEADFMARIHRELAWPQTCGVGYNSIRFDDEFTRYGLYRNFFDPYGREWQSGNSRWDIIDMVRLTYALRPEGIQWPTNEDGTPSFKLEALTASNGISHEAAHDALSDVYATIAIARLIRERQPRLFDYLLGLRNKRLVGRQLDMSRQTPVLHVTAMYPACYGRIAMVAPVAHHPTNKNGVVVFDLRYDPRQLRDLSVEELHFRLFTPTAELPEGVERLPLKTVHLNKCPVIVPMNTLTPAAAEKWQIDTAAGERHLSALRAMGGLEKKIQKVLQRQTFGVTSDPDQNLYGGGFFGDEDRRRMETIRAASPEELAGLHLAFDDKRLPEMLFRYRARNWPQTLNGDEKARWEEYRRGRLTETDGGGSITLDRYVTRIGELKADPETPPEKQPLLDDLLAWGRSLL